MNNLFQRKSAVDEYEKRSVGKTEAEKRVLEETLLGPTPLARVIIAPPSPVTPINRYVKVYFATQEEFDEFCQLVPVGNSHEYTTRHSTTILAALRNYHE